MFTYLTFLIHDTKVWIHFLCLHVSNLTYSIKPLLSYSWCSLATSAPVERLFSEWTVNETKQSTHVKLPAGNSRVFEMQQFTLSVICLCVMFCWLPCAKCDMITINNWLNYCSVLFSQLVKFNRQVNGHGKSPWSWRWPWGLSPC